MSVLGVDVGGTAVKTWWRDAPGPGAPTPRDDADGRRTADLVAALAASTGARALGVAVPGVVDDAEGVCRLSVNLGWRDVDVRAQVAARTGLPVRVVQDVRAGAVAERRRGAGRSAAGPMLFAPLGTGLALAVVDAAGDPVGDGWAGEVGQLRIAAGALAGLRVEQVASAGGFAARAGAADALTATAAVRAGDVRAVALWDDLVQVLADVLAPAVAVTGARLVVLGGGLSGSGALLTDPVGAALDRRLAGFPRVEVLPAALGPHAGAAGAALLADGAR